MGEDIDIEITQEVADGIYANLAVIAHSSSEFVLDFARLLPGNDKLNIKSRIILAPEHAKRLLLSLQDNIRKYEKNFGEIKIHFMPHEQESLHVTPLGEA